MQEIKEVKEASTQLGPYGCKCKTLGHRLGGDGCDMCNPELAAEYKWDAEADGYNQWHALGQDERDELIAEEKARIERERKAYAETSKEE
jgi:hypothetical protein